ncbi:uncharacterized protein LOC114760382 [Neltuma alba]|uniref:uncharacterized protein LOC114760382 n=1 Tax=Neltuma alba TaxID=207710 RepID=UPI0010A2F874|nr:uncharacterized protein LOC114760382 [Prosopis alba]
MGSVSTGKSLARLRRGGAGGTLSHFLATKWVAYASPISSSSYSFSSAASVASSSGFQPSPPSSEIEGKSSRWSKWFLFLPGAITFGLGTWQIFRRQEKMLEACKMFRTNGDVEKKDGVCRKINGFLDEYLPLLKFNFHEVIRFQIPCLNIG